MTISNNLNSLQGIGSAFVSGIDIETALLAVQSQRAGLLEGQLKTQLNDVQNRNHHIGKLNEVMSQARTLSAKFASEAKNSDALPECDELTNFQTAAKNAGISISDISNKGELLTAIENFKSSIDTESNSQQMDMLRLQSLSNKRNESYDVMTNFIKKMQEGRSSIIGNMR